MLIIWPSTIAIRCFCVILRLKCRACEFYITDFIHLTIFMWLLTFRLKSTWQCTKLCTCTVHVKIGEICSSVFERWKRNNIWKKIEIITSHKKTVQCFISCILYISYIFFLCKKKSYTKLFSENRTTWFVLV